jgi:hypothetical protein
MVMRAAAMVRTNSSGSNFWPVASGALDLRQHVDRHALHASSLQCHDHAGTILRALMRDAASAALMPASRFAERVSRSW